jgi:protoporphyrinogen/coproporphyrinogen III oxidase
MSTARKHVIVIGGGVSGLTCAYRLQQRGWNVTVLEAANRVGGFLQSATHPAGFRYEEGPLFFVDGARLMTLVREVGLDSDLLTTDLMLPRYVYHRHGLHPLPLTLRALLSTRLIGVGSKLRALREFLGRAGTDGGGETVAEFIASRFGREVLQRVAAPVVASTHAGDVNRLSAEFVCPDLLRRGSDTASDLTGFVRSCHDSDSGGKGERLCSFTKGLRELPRRLAEKLGKENIELGVQLKKIAPAVQDGHSRFLFQLVLSDGERETQADAVVFAAGAFRTAEIVEPFADKLAQELFSIEHPPLTVASVAYSREDVARATEGFGVLVPGDQGVRMLACVWTSSIFPGRAPEGLVLMRVSLGGATDTDIALAGDDKIVAVLKRDLKSTLGIIIAPEVVAMQRYERALPQYTLGHERRVRRIEAEAARIPGMFLTGNYLRGFSIGACVRTAEETAEQVTAYLEEHSTIPREGSAS